MICFGNIVFLSIVFPIVATPIVATHRHEQIMYINVVNSLIPVVFIGEPVLLQFQTDHCKKK